MPFASAPACRPASRRATMPEASILHDVWSHSARVGDDRPRLHLSQHRKPISPLELEWAPFINLDSIVT